MGRGGALQSLHFAGPERLTQMEVPRSPFDASLAIPLRFAGGKGVSPALHPTPSPATTLNTQGSGGAAAAAATPPMTTPVGKLLWTMLAGLVLHRTQLS
jgi:hypothetical protein